MPDSSSRTASRDLTLSLAMLTAVVVFALTGLGLDGNWSKVTRVAAAFATYGAVLIVMQPRRHEPGAPIAFRGFLCAGIAAGIVSGLVRPEFSMATLISGALLAGVLFGGAHWAAIAYWRALHARLVARATHV